MTQRIFDVENEKDMADLWDILPDDINKIERFGRWNRYYNSCSHETLDFIKINWHNKKEIERPIQEATKEDFKKLCLFWDDNYSGKGVIGLLSSIDGESVCNRYYMEGGTWWAHCRRLTKTEIEELC